MRRRKREEWRIEGVLRDVLRIKHLMSGEHDVAHAGNLVAAGRWIMTYPWIPCGAYMQIHHCEINKTIDHTTIFSIDQQ
jgi:hypothetical protein